MEQETSWKWYTRKDSAIKDTRDNLYFLDRESTLYTPENKGEIQEKNGIERKRDNRMRYFCGSN